MATPDLANIQHLIPTGRIHRLDLINRGWTAAMIDTHLHDVVKIDGVPQGISNKTYSSAEISHVETTITEVRKAVSDRADLIPPGPHPYTAANTIPRTQLIRRGWTRHTSSGSSAHPT